MQEANLLAALGRPDEAVALLDGLIAAAPANPDLLADAGDMLRSASEHAAAIPLLHQGHRAGRQPAAAGAWVLYFDRGICEDSLGIWNSRRAGYADRR